jgi:hypothetical protein
LSLGSEAAVERVLVARYKRLLKPGYQLDSQGKCKRSLSWMYRAFKQSDMVCRDHMWVMTSVLRRPNQKNTLRLLMSSCTTQALLHQLGCASNRALRICGG